MTGIPIREASQVTTLPSTGLIPLEIPGLQTAYSVLLPDLTNLSGLFSVKSHSAVGDGITDDTQAIADTIAEAEAAGTFNVVFLPPGIYKVTNIDLSGKSALLWGSGNSTIIRASGNTGAVISMARAYSQPFTQKTEFGNFRLEGDNTAGATKIGIDISGCMGTVFRNISISKTGGQCIRLASSGGSTQCHFNVFENIVFYRPVSANVNNVPYLELKDICNANIFQNCGFVSETGTVDAANGVIYIHCTVGGAWYPDQNQFINCWMEFCHAADQSSLIYLSGGSQNRFHNFIFFDCSKLAASTLTSYFKIDEGVYLCWGNEIDGFIPGYDSGNTTKLNYGVILNASRNRVSGIRGYKGSNVRLGTDVQYNSVHLYGSESAVYASMTAAVDDQSGNTDNVIIDDPLQVYNLGGIVHTSYDGTTKKLGFFGTAPVAKQTVTGSAGGNAALVDLLAKLEATGLIVDSSS